LELNEEVGGLRRTGLCRHGPGVGNPALGPSGSLETEWETESNAAWCARQPATPMDFFPEIKFWLKHNQGDGIRNVGDQLYKHGAVTAVITA